MKFLATQFQICRQLWSKSADESIRWTGRITSAELGAMTRTGQKCVRQQLVQLISVIFQYVFKLHIRHKIVRNGTIWCRRFVAADLMPRNLESATIWCHFFIDFRQDSLLSNYSFEFFNFLYYLSIPRLNFSYYDEILVLLHNPPPNMAKKFFF